MIVKGHHSCTIFLTVLLFSVGPMLGGVPALFEEPESAYVSAPASVAAAESLHHTKHSWRHIQSLLKDAVVQIFSEAIEFNWLEPYKTPAQGQGCGSGFFISDTGEIITNFHVVESACGLSIQIPSLGKRRFDVYIVGLSPDRDLAILRLCDADYQVIKKALGKIPVLTLGSSEDLYRGDEVMAVGYPLGQQSLKSTNGMVSGSEHLGGQHMIQISAPINPGSSGCPVFSMNGEVVGVSRSGIIPAQNVGYIIPIDEVKLFIEQVRKTPEPSQGTVKFLRKPYLGILFNTATEELIRYLGNPEPGGLYVAESLKGSPLAKAGVKAGDMIYAINGHQIDIYGEMQVAWNEDKVSVLDYLSRLMPNDTIKLVVYRKGKRLECTFVFKQSDLTPIRFRYPLYEPVEYEAFGGMVVMPLSLNHLPILIKASPDLVRYMDVRKQMTPALVVTHIMVDSKAARARTIMPGMTIAEVNGKKVGTLEEFRNAVKESEKTGYFTIKTAEKMFTVFAFNDILEQERKLSRLFHYPLSDYIQEILTKYEKQKKA